MRHFLTIILLAGCFLVSCSKKDASADGSTPAVNNKPEIKTKLLVTFDGNTMIFTDSSKVYGSFVNDKYHLDASGKEMDRFYMSLGDCKVGEYDIDSKGLDNSNPSKVAITMNGVLYTSYLNTSEFSKGAKVQPRGTIFIKKVTDEYIEGLYDIFVSKNSEGQKALTIHVMGSFLVPIRK
jgi:hypothetical protein